jgi:hypothetical protein
MDVVSDFDLRTAISRAAERENLGEHRRTYVAVRPNTRRHAIEAVGVLLCGLAALIGAATGAAVITILCVTGVLMIGVRLLCELAWLAYVCSRNRDTRLDLYDHGFVVIVGGRARAVRYDSTTVRRNIVAHVGNPAPEQISHSYTVIDSIGDPIVLRHTIAHPEEWGPEIDRAVTEAQLPRAIATLDVGGRLDFEYFWMTPAEIGAAHRSVSWSRVSGIVVHKGWVSVRITGESLPLESLPVSLIPDFTLFRTVAERMREAHVVRP